MSTSYIEIIASLPPRAIRSDDELDEVVATMDSLLERGDLSADEQDYLNTLSILVEAYEDERFPLPDVSGVDVLRHLMEANELRQTDLLDIFPTRSVISEVLSGSRQMTLGHMRGLSQRFGLPIDVFAS
ncbi:MAG: hypothetical protein M9890_10245 [Thermomicrobiales bacterium]|nr:hypothetical protein [Thermomicrobiales bacterium]